MLSRRRTAGRMFRRHRHISPTGPFVRIMCRSRYDFLARLVGEYVSRGNGQQVIIENKVVAGGLVGAELVANSAADGYTLLASHGVATSGPPIVPFNLYYLKKLVPVIQPWRVPIVLAVHPSLGVTSVAELIALAKRWPGMSYATFRGRHTAHHIGEWLDRCRLGVADFAHSAPVELSRRLSEQSCPGSWSSSCNTLSRRITSSVLVAFELGGARDTGVEGY